VDGWMGEKTLLAFSMSDHFSTPCSYSSSIEPVLATLRGSTIDGYL
jgi:hypothetical protein